MKPQSSAAAHLAPVQFGRGNGDPTFERGAAAQGPPSLSVLGPPATAPVEDEDARYRHELGTRLRNVRVGQGLRLQDVEKRSGGRFKGVVVGSYERGDRAVSAHKLAQLATVYGVPVGELLPEEVPPRPVDRNGLRLAVDRLASHADDPSLAPLRRLADHVRAIRGDHDGHYLTLRQDDLSTVAVAMDLTPEDLADRLRLRGLLAD